MGRTAFDRFWFVACAAVLLLGLGAGAQTPAGRDQQQQQQPPIKVETNLVRVDVYPSRGGQPVLDLKQEDFEVLEDNTPQTVSTFEHVVVKAVAPDTERIEVPSQRESLQAAANPRNRVFVIFLDTPNVTIGSAYKVNEPLIRLVNRILGPDDLVGVMTPAMAASQVVLGRKTQVIEDSLRQNWPWGTRFTLQRDEREEAYVNCYPPLTTERGEVSALAAEMIKRKRERATLESLADLVRYLRTIRDERKAILIVSEGWLLFTEDRGLMTLRKDPQTGVQEAPPRVDPVGVGPNGKLTTKDARDRDLGPLTMNECDTDRMRLSMMDDDRYFKDLMDEANYGNATFYPIDPRGLPVFDTEIGPEPPPSIIVDHAMLKKRIENMRTMAENTDGIAVVESNDLDRGMRRISDDLSSYYLLGYYSTNTKLDGRFRSLKVRVKKPGVDVRARRGYRAATEKEITAARRAADAPIPDATRVVNAAIDKLSRIRGEARFHVNAAVASGGTVWIAGELQPAGGRPDEFAQGGTADIETVAGSVTARSRVTLKPGERTFITKVTLQSTPSSELTIKARLTSPEGGSVPLSDMIRIDARASSAPLLYRRGPSTGNRLLPAADFHYSRTDRAHLEIPVGADVKPGQGKILDRAGQTTQVPVTVGERTDEASGQRFITADAILGALAAGDFAIEVELLGASTERVVTGIRIAR